MDRTADLDAALKFVIARIEKEATVSGETLNDEERLLLRHLPSSIPPTIYLNPEFPPLVPRNLDLERICALGKAAYLNDRKINPGSLDWEFASAVFTLNDHPMWGVLHSAGVKMYRKPLRDQFLVIVAALCPVIAVILLAWGGRGPSLFRWAGILLGAVGTMLLIFFASRRMEQRQLENHIETCRLATRNTSWIAS